MHGESFKSLGEWLTPKGFALIEVRCGRCSRRLGSYLATSQRTDEAEPLISLSHVASVYRHHARVRDDQTRGPVTGARSFEATVHDGPRGRMVSYRWRCGCGKNRKHPTDIKRRADRFHPLPVKDGAIYVS